MSRPLQNINSSQDGALRETESTIPCGCAHGLTVMGEVSISGRILSLIGQENPPHISLGIVAVRVNSVYGMMRRWLWSHVSKKCREPIPLVPLRAYAYAACAVAFVFGNIGVIAATPDIHPRSVFRGASAKMGVPVFSWGTLPLLVVAPAGSRPSAPQLTSVNDGLLSANASAQPLDLSGLVPLRPYGGESSKYLSRNIFSDFHSAVIPGTRSSRVALETMKLREHRLSGYPPIQRDYSTASVLTVNT